MIAYEVPKVTVDNAPAILHSVSPRFVDDLQAAHEHGILIVRAAQVLREAEKMAKRKATEV